jgi:hypothetical protein
MSSYLRGGIMTKIDISRKRILELRHLVDARDRVTLGVPLPGDHEVLDAYRNRDPLSEIVCELVECEKKARNNLELSE